MRQIEWAAAKGFACYALNKDKGRRKRSAKKITFGTCTGRPRELHDMQTERERRNKREIYIMGLDA